MIVVSKETHSSLFSVKNQIALQKGSVITYDEVIKQLVILFKIHTSVNNPFKLENKE